MMATRPSAVCWRRNRNGHEHHTNVLQSWQLYGKAHRRDPVSRRPLTKGMSKMADAAHYQTDLKLEEMEKRLSAIYSKSGTGNRRTVEIISCRSSIWNWLNAKSLWPCKKGRRYIPPKIDKMSYRQKRNACHHITAKKGGRDNGKSKGQSVVWQCQTN